MGKRVWIFIGFVWFALVAGVGCYLAQDYQPGKYYTIYNQSCKGGTDTYVSENRVKGALLYRIGEDKRVLAVYDTGRIDAKAKVSGIAYKEGLYVLLQKKGQTDDKSEVTYRIYRMNSSLNPVEVSDELHLDASGVLSGFYVSDDKFYLTLLSGDGRIADVYEADKTIMKDAGEQKEAEEQQQSAGKLLRSEMTQECEDGHFFVSAGWDGKKLLFRTDVGMEDGEWQSMIEAKAMFEGKRMSFMQRVLLTGKLPAVCLVIFVAGCGMLWMFAKLLKNRNRIIYMALVMETALLVITLAGAGLISEKRKEMQVREYSRFGFFAMEDLMERIGSLGHYGFGETDFYAQQDYYTLQNELAETVVRSGSTQIFYDLCVVRLRDHAIVASASGRNGYKAEDVYTNAAGRLLDQLTMTAEEIVSEMEMQGQKYGLLALSDSRGAVPEYALLGITRQESLIDDLQQDVKGIVWMIAVFAVGSVFCFLILWIQSEDLRRLCTAMQAVATGRDDIRIEKSMVIGNDMAAMWNSLYEVNKTIKNVYYTKYLMFEAYYRFAPKQIERILNKDSITEVKSGDAIHLNGTIAMISTKQTKRIALQKNQKDGQVNLEDMNRLLALIAHYQEEDQGILISNDGTLSAMKMLFLPGSKNTVNFGIEFGHMLEEAKDEGRFEAAVLLHRADVLYGIAGVKEQSMPFLISEEIKELEQYARWLRELGLRLVITDNVDRGDCAVRYIGYFEIAASPDKIKLYEILDVCPEKERRAKLSYDDKFQKAIKLFYQNDFYLSRSAFTEIVKESPEDKIAKWYLFTCEKYLNETHTGTISCKLNQ